MNLGPFEEHLLPVVRDAVGRDAVVRAGPPRVNEATGLRLEVCVHAVAFEDVETTDRGWHLPARRPAEMPDGGLGFAEERPARILIEITCTGPAHALLQQACGDIAAPVLVALESMPRPVLSGSKETGTTLRFDDLVAAVSGVSTRFEPDVDGGYHSARLRFRVDGYLHVTVTTRRISSGTGRRRSGTAREIRPR